MRIENIKILLLITVQMFIMGNFVTYGQSILVNEEAKTEQEVLNKKETESTSLTSNDLLNEGDSEKTSQVPPLLITSLILNILLIIAAIYFYIELKKIKRTRGKKRKSSNSESKTVDDINDKEASLELEQQIDNRLELVKPKFKEELINVFKKELPNYLAEIEHKKTNDKIINEPKVIYATAVNKDNGSFFSTNENVDEEIVYRLNIDEHNNKRANFSIEKQAHNWILKCPEYLEGGCDVQDTGSLKIIDEESGVAELQSDGNWRVVKKAKVKFI